MRVGEAKLKILFVCFSYSIHAARWIRFVTELGWDVHVVPSQDFDALHPEFRDVTYWPAQPASFVPGPTIRVRTASPALRAKAAGTLDLAQYLARLLEEERFDIVHSLEIQHAGYIALHPVRYAPEPRPRWIVTNYGSDIFLFGRYDDHAPRIRTVLAECDFYAAECMRDVRLAIEMGFAGRLFEVCPNGGGVNLAECAPLRSPLPPSRRRVIAVKGYEHFAGRALTVVGVLESVAPLLRGYQVVFHSPAPTVREAATAVSRRTGLSVGFLADHEPHETILALHGQSRLSIANSLSDGISTALLEAMAMGSFPIQSRTACTDEWFTHGRTGLRTDPEDPGSIRRAIETALRDDDLVDRAAPINLDTIRRRADRDVLRGRASLAYARVAESVREARAAAVLPKPSPRPPGPVPRPTVAAPEPDPVAGRRPTLTVITPSYNRAGFMQETIESVLSQDFDDFEYLILDDGSKDDTEEVVRRFDDPRIRYARHDNVGETTTVNRALRQVRGEFFTIINSDDPAVAGSFSILVEQLRADGEALLAYPDWYVIDETSKVLRTIRMPAFDLPRLLTNGSVPIGPGAMFRSTVLEKVGYRNPLLKYCADLDYIYRTALAGRILHVPQVLGSHRVHPGSASLADRGSRLARETLYPFQAYAQHPRLSEDVQRQHRQALAAGIFSASFVTTGGSDAVRLLARAFLAHPVRALELVESHGVQEIIDRLEGLGLARRPRPGIPLERLLERGSRVAALRPTLRALLTDPIRLLDAVRDRPPGEIRRRIRSMPARG